MRCLENTNAYLNSGNMQTISNEILKNHRWPQVGVRADFNCKLRFDTSFNNSSEKQIKTAPSFDESMAPIRIDFELDGIKIKDTFMWNVNDTLILPEMFVDGLLRDFNVNQEVKAELYPLVLKSMKDQIEDFITYGGKRLFMTQSGQGAIEDIEVDPMVRELRIPIKVDTLIID